jgi:hypothetical protein
MSQLRSFDGRAAALCVVVVSAVVAAGCARPAANAEPPGHDTRVTRSQGPVRAEYDTKGRLQKIEYDRNGDGKPDAWGYMDGSRVVRVEVDENGDGTVDRWEYHRAVDGEPAATPDPGGVDRTLERIERATDHDGHINRWEFFTDGVLTRVEEDTNHDGRVDKWETYANGALATMAIDTTSRGKPDRRFVYGPDGNLARIETDPNGTGTFTPLNLQ